MLINQTGRAITDVITMPDDGTGTQTLTMPFTSTKFVESFEAGVTETGAADPDAELVISAGGVFTIHGTVKFARQPNGRVDVDIPNAGVAISAPTDNGLLKIIELKGTARFAFGGGQPFSLQDLRVNGFEVLGHGFSTQTPTTSLRPPTADLASPYAGQKISIADLNAQGYIDVLYRDLNGGGIDATSITDDSPEFVLARHGGRERPDQRRRDPARSVRPAHLPLPAHEGRLEPAAVRPGRDRHLRRGQVPARTPSATSPARRTRPSRSSSTSSRPPRSRPRSRSPRSRARSTAP